MLSDAENSGKSQYETIVIRENSIRKANFSRLVAEEQVGKGVLLGKIYKRVSVMNYSRKLYGHV